MGGKVRKRERGEEEEGRGQGRRGKGERRPEGDADVMLYSVKGGLTFA